MNTMSATEARAALPEILDRVAAGDEVTITRHGTPIAVVVPIGTLRVRRAERVLTQAQRLDELVTKLSSAQLEGAATNPISAERADQLVADLRSGRDSR